MLARATPYKRPEQGFLVQSFPVKAPYNETYEKLSPANYQDNC